MNSLKTGLFAAVVTAALTTGATAQDTPKVAPFDKIQQSAPRSPFDQLYTSAPRAPFDQIQTTAPRSPDALNKN